MKTFFLETASLKIVIVQHFIHFSTHSIACNSWKKIKKQASTKNILSLERTLFLCRMENRTEKNTVSRVMEVYKMGKQQIRFIILHSKIHTLRQGTRYCKEEFSLLSLIFYFPRFNYKKHILLVHMPCGRYWSMFSLEFLVPFKFDCPYTVKKITMYQGNCPISNTWDAKKEIAKKVFSINLCLFSADILAITLD